MPRVYTRGSLAERLSARIRVTASGCWEYQGAKGRWGYGKMGNVFGKTVAAHRVSWIVHNGPIPHGLFVLHHCDNPPCVNPAHLFLGTQADNMQDGSRKHRVGRQKKTDNVCKRGHLLSPENVRERPTTVRGKPVVLRECRTCVRMLDLERYHRMKKRRRTLSEA